MTGIVPPSATDLFDTELDYPETLSASVCNAIRQAMKVQKKERPLNVDLFEVLLINWQNYMKLEKTVGYNWNKLYVEDSTKAVEKTITFEKNARSSKSKISKNLYEYLDFNKISIIFAFLITVGLLIRAFLSS